MAHKKDRGAVRSVWHRLANSVSHSSTKPDPTGTRRGQLARRLRIEPLEDRCLLAVFTVSNVLDTGSGSLRQAILNANNTSAADTIEFKIGTGPQTISPASALPAITAPVTLDGTTQMGSTGPPIIELNGTNAGASANGLTLSGGSSTVRGLAISRFAIGIYVASNGNIVQENTIRFNNGAGVLVSQNTGNAIRSNSIFSNAGQGIDLSPNGVTLNDANDPDIGSNNLQNFPVLTSVTSGSSGTTIAGWLDSTPGIPFTLQFFSNSVADPTGFGEGQTYLGSTVVTTNSAGDANFLVNLSAAAPVGQLVTATATDPNGNTSEFSRAILVTPKLDFGDAPASYATVLASNGARHVISSGLRLGSGVDDELDGQPSTAADGDDTHGTDDDDGVLFTSPLRVGELNNVLVSASMPGLLGAWIDFNRDGDWGDGGEQIFANRSLVSGTNSLSFTVPPTALPGNTFARFRLSSQSNLPFGGLAPDGEVEDCPIVIVDNRQFDFGDAPESYSTLLADDGARHLIFPAVRLGAGLDDEVDGIPNAAADGDDQNTSDDEDGVTFTPPVLLTGDAASVQVVATVAGFLNAWTDWNLDGDFEDAGEQMFADTALAVGANQLNFDVPASAVAGETYARFRFSTQAGLSFGGSASDGEVEDYRVSVETTAEIHGSKWNDLDADGVRDDGEPGLEGWTIFLDTDNDGVLDDGERSTTTDANGDYVFTGLEPGPYTVGEVMQAGWTQSQPAPSRTVLNGLIAFVSDRDDYGIYTMNPAGTEQTYLAYGSAPAWSPDGSQIACVDCTEDIGGTNDIFVINADGTQLTNLTNSAAANHTPAWSPDGSQIAFMSLRDGNAEIYVMNADGTGQTNLTNSALDELFPTWSPDGSRIAFECVGVNVLEICVMNADGTGRISLGNHPAGDPAWSPDSSQIAFVSSLDRANYEIYVMNADGTEAINVSNHAGYDAQAAWSPDSSQIAFLSRRDGNDEIYVMNADGTEQTNVSNNATTDTSPAWQPKPVTVLGVYRVILASGERIEDLDFGNFFVPPVLHDIDVLDFTSGGLGALDQFQITYEITGSDMPPFDFAFYSSDDARYDSGDTRSGPVRSIIEPNDRTAGRHTVIFSGAAYAAYLTDPNANFFLVAADTAGAVAETDKTNNDRNFVGIFHAGTFAAPAPLVMRGRDDTDRYADDPHDAVTIGDLGDSISLATSFTPSPIIVAADSIHVIRLIGVGGDDAFTLDGRLTATVVAGGGTDRTSILGGAGDDTMTVSDSTTRMNGVGVTHYDASLEELFVEGGFGNDTILADETRDRNLNLKGGDGDDLLVGGLGNDVLHGGPGHDALYGGPGRDRLFAAVGSNSNTIEPVEPLEPLEPCELRLEQDWPFLTASLATDAAAGDESIQVCGRIPVGTRILIRPGYENEEARSVTGVVGNEAPYTLVLDQPLLHDHLAGQLVRVLEVHLTNDLLDGGPGDDHLTGSPDDDTLLGGLGADDIRSGLGQDLILGGPGDDLLMADQDLPCLDTSSMSLEEVLTPLFVADIGLLSILTLFPNGILSMAEAIRGDRAGDDYMDGGDGSDVLEAGCGNDFLVDWGTDAAELDRLSGGFDSDLLIPGPGDDHAEGGEGDDIFVQRLADTRLGGRDVFDGGAGEDVALFGGSRDGDDSFSVSHGSGIDQILIGLNFAGVAATADLSSLARVELDGGGGSGSDMLTVRGDASDNHYTLEATGPVDGKVRESGGPEIEFRNFAQDGSVRFDGGGGADSFAATHLPGWGIDSVAFVGGGTPDPGASASITATGQDDAFRYAPSPAGSALLDLTSGGTTTHYSTSNIGSISIDALGEITADSLLVPTPGEIQHTTGPEPGSGQVRVAFSGQDSGVTLSYRHVETVNSQPISPSPTDPSVADLERLESESLRPVTIRFEHGIPRFVSARVPVPASVPDDPVAQALDFLGRYRELYRLEDPNRQLFLKRIQTDSLGGVHVFFGQHRDGVPLHVATIAVHLRSAGGTGPQQTWVTSTGGNYVGSLPDLPAPVLRTVDAETAAIADAPGTELQPVGVTKLMYFNAGVSGGSSLVSETHLAWRVMLRGFRASEGMGTVWIYFIDAHDGSVLRGRDQSREDAPEKDFEIGSVLHQTSDTCFDFPWERVDDLMDETGPLLGYRGDFPGGDIDADNVYFAAHDTYDYFFENFHRHSFDGDDETLDMMIRVGRDWQNARYIAECDQFQFGDGITSLGTVAHEFTHGITSSTADLEYEDRSGALNESYSDFFGAMLDGNWTVGEGEPGGIIRDMSNPQLFGQPDHMDLIIVTDRDNGGVHTNSGIPNNVAFLITDGGMHAVSRIPVQGIGREKAQRLYYDVLTTRLSENSGFIAARDETVEQAQEYVDQRVYEFTARDVCSVTNAFASVGLGPSDVDCDQVPDDADNDDDGDQVPDDEDNAPLVANPRQEDRDGDGIGDVTDRDADGDGVDEFPGTDSFGDNCPTVANPNQQDTDNDGIGNACEDEDVDENGDPHPDGVYTPNDNCRFVYNRDQANNDGDILGDACDPNDDNDAIPDDGDGSGVAGDNPCTGGDTTDCDDNAPFTANSRQEDDDSDGVGNVVDNCLGVANRNQTDTDGDGMGDTCDDDDDGDDIPDTDDLCPLLYEELPIDLDNNGIGLRCDPDEAFTLSGEGAGLLEGVLRFESPLEALRIPIFPCLIDCPDWLPENYTTWVDIQLPFDMPARIIDDRGFAVRKGPGGGPHKLMRFFVDADYHSRLTNIGLPGELEETPTLPIDGDLPVDGDFLGLSSDSFRGRGYFLEILPTEQVEPGQLYPFQIRVRSGLREAVPPMLSGVTLGSTQWTQPFRDVLDPMNGLGFPLPTGSDQLKALPWSHIDQVFIHFSEDVSVDRSQVGLFGVNRADYSSAIATFTYDAESHIAAVTLSEPLGVEKLLLTVFDSIQDLSGNRLDGEWFNEVNTFSSGDGAAGGTFAIRINIVPGDTNRSGGVAVNDVGPLRSGLGSTVGSALYSVFADLNGSGAIAVNDVGQIRTNLGRSLPTGEPSLPTIPAVPAAIFTKNIDRLMRQVAIRDDAWLDNLSDEDLTSIADSLIPGLWPRRGAAFRT